MFTKCDYSPEIIYIIYFYNLVVQLEINAIDFHLDNSELIKLE